jgi:hypothetical protein
MCSFYYATPIQDEVCLLFGVADIYGTHHLGIHACHACQTLLQRARRRQPCSTDVLQVAAPEPDARQMPNSSRPAETIQIETGRARLPATRCIVPPTENRPGSLEEQKRQLNSDPLLRAAVCTASTSAGKYADGHDGQQGSCCTTEQLCCSTGTSAGAPVKAQRRSACWPVQWCRGVCADGGANHVQSGA